MSFDDFKLKKTSNCTLWLRRSFILREASELWDSGKHFFGMTPYFSKRQDGLGYIYTSTVQFILQG